ncbi:MAG: serine hydrolase [Actinobacteria bacterium]|nr:serine hydrolase [Actinomycetota bacterium]
MNTPLSRRSLLSTAGLTAAGLVTGGFAASTLTGCSGPNIARPTASPNGAITAQLDEVLKTIANGSDKFGVYVQDVRTGGTYSFNGDYASQNASMVKVMIALMALRKAGGLLGADLDPVATKMITQSDNDSAETLWAYGGGADAYQTLADELKMTHTHRDENRPDWSWTWTTPSDQVLLLTYLTEGGTDAFTTEQGAYVYGLMGKVQDDQTWGVGQPKSSDVQVHLKNGWVQFKSSDNLWAVNSMGTVEGSGRNYRLAVMTRVADFATGREVTSEVGKWVFSILGSGTL